MKRTIITLLYGALLAIGCPTLAGSQVLIPSKGTISMNGLWDFKYLPSSDISTDSLFFNPTFDTSSWKKIATPGSWELQGFATPFYGKNLKEGTGLYRCDFSVPADWKGKSVYLVFDGVQYGFKIWVNGQYVGSFTSSFNRSIFDISSFVQPEKSNLLAVRVSTRPKGWEFDTNDCWSLSGIIRDVTLFSLPPSHIRDVVVKTVLKKGDATLSVSAFIDANKDFKKLSVQGKLFDPEGKLVKTFPLVFKKSSSPLTYLINIEKPLLWTAETPHLYTLEVILSNGKNELQRYSERIGLREISWSGGVLKLNGAPIKLRGINHHDLSPVNGRTITEADMLDDLELMRRASINFIRTSHYPPHPRLLELCDLLGFYVMDEVPFGFGEEHLKDTSYLHILKSRALATVSRDKNHPSVIIWSVGNENPLTDMCLETGKFVKSLDSTRPFCFPQIGSYFRSISGNFPNSIDILAPHYPVPSVLREYAGKFDRPMIVTEYSHSLGLDFDRMEELWEIMYACPKMAGGAVWHFFDQGILRKSAEPIKPDAFTTSVWIDSVTVLDNSGNEGADGIVYANRVPQVDFWEVRKVYTPVKPLDDTLFVHPGKQAVQLHLNNRYDFTDLSETVCRWELRADTLMLDSGIYKPKCAPHDTAAISIEFALPEKPTANFYYLNLLLSDKSGYQFYEKTYPLHFVRNISYPTPHQMLLQGLYQPVRIESNKTTVSKGNFNLQLNDSTGMIQLTDHSGEVLIANGPYLRTGRKPTMSEKANTVKSPSGKSPVWIPYLLTKPIVKTETAFAGNKTIGYSYEREDQKGQFFNGKVEYNTTDSGRIDIYYNFKPKNAQGNVLEAGISFLIPATFSEFRWAGQGPYPAYPGKDRLDEFGLYHLNSGDLNFQGNRPGVDIAVFSDNTGKGFALIAYQANLSVECVKEGIIVSHNTLVSGRFNKFSWPETLYKMDDIKELSGSFSIVPLDSNWPKVLRSLFGNPTIVAVPFKPFYNSYDQ